MYLTLRSVIYELEYKS